MFCEATIAMIFVFFFFYDIAYTPMLVAYTLEILPFNFRAKGFAVLVSEESPCEKERLSNKGALALLRTSLYASLSLSTNLSTPGLWMP